MAAVKIVHEHYRCLRHSQWVEQTYHNYAQCPKCDDELGREKEREQAYEKQMSELEAAMGKDGPRVREDRVAQALVAECVKQQEFIHDAVRTEGSRMPKGKETGMLDKLKRLDLERMDLDEAVYLVSIGKAMRSVYEAESLETPQWLTDNVRELSREITNRMAESREKALREVELELLALRSRDEKKSDLVAKAERLKAQLGRSTPAVDAQ